jgi:hypothetical protein
MNRRISEKMGRNQLDQAILEDAAGERVCIAAEYAETQHQIRKARAQYLGLCDLRDRVTLLLEQKGEDFSTEIKGGEVLVYRQGKTFVVRDEVEPRLVQKVSLPWGHD